MRAPQGSHRTSVQGRTCRLRPSSCFGPTHRPGMPIRRAPAGESPGGLDVRGQVLRMWRAGSVPQPRRPHGTATVPGHDGASPTPSCAGSTSGSRSSVHGGFPSPTLPQARRVIVLVLSSAGAVGTTSGSPGRAGAQRAKGRISAHVAARARASAAGRAFDERLIRRRSNPAQSDVAWGFVVPL